MIAYLFTFTLSLYFVSLAQRCKSRKGILLLSTIALLFPVILAGIRAESVGSDTSFYIIRNFEDAVSAKGNLLLYYAMYPNFEILYILENYLVSLLTSNNAVFLTINHLLVMIPLYCAALKWKHKLSPVFFMFIFYCTYYNESLSTIRQSIAMSFGLLAFSYYYCKNKGMWLIYSLIAIGFHNTAIIVLSFPLVYAILKRYPLKRCIKSYVFIGMFFMIIMMNVESFIIFLIDRGLIDSRYIGYTSEGGIFEGDLGLTNFVLKIIILVYLFVIWKRRKIEADMDFFVIMAFLDFSFSLLGIFVSHLIRLSLYPRLMSCISIPVTMNRLKVMRISKYGFLVLSNKGLICLFMITYWYYVYIYGDFAATSEYLINPQLFK